MTKVEIKTQLLFTHDCSSGVIPLQTL